jgi:hypothetical protein
MCLALVPAAPKSDVPTRTPARWLPRSCWRAAAGASHLPGRPAVWPPSHVLPIRRSCRCCRDPAAARRPAHYCCLAGCPADCGDGSASGWARRRPMRPEDGDCMPWLLRPPRRAEADADLITPRRGVAWQRKKQGTSTTRVRTPPPTPGLPFPVQRPGFLRCFVLVLVRRP